MRVVHEPQNANLNPGEIMVCREADPAWTPLFLTAGGVIMETGGLMTHGVIVARKYAIPAVVRVYQVCQKLETGQQVKLDGSSGKILLIESL